MQGLQNSMIGTAKRTIMIHFRTRTVDVLVGKLIIMVLLAVPIMLFYKPHFNSFLTHASPPLLPCFPWNILPVREPCGPRLPLTDIHWQYLPAFGTFAGSSMFLIIEEVENYER